MTVNKDYATACLIAIPKDVLTVIDASAKVRRQTRTSFIVESVVKRLIDEGILDYGEVVKNVLASSSDAVISLLAPKVVPLALLLCLAVAPAFADDQRPATYAEKHPIISAPVVMPYRAIKWIGRKLHLQPVGTVIKKTGSAVSDGVIHFGQWVQPYQPAANFAGSASQTVTPMLVPLWRH